MSSGPNVRAYAMNPPGDFVTVYGVCSKKIRPACPLSPKIRYRRKHIHPADMRECWQMPTSTKSPFLPARSDVYERTATETCRWGPQERIGGVWCRLVDYPDIAADTRSMKT